MQSLEMAGVKLGGSIVDLRRATASNGSAFAARAALAAICTAVFALAICVRLLHWQDSHLEIVREGTLLTDLGKPYVNDAREMAGQWGLLFPREEQDTGDATLLEHPPGYSIIWAALYGDHASVHSAVLLRTIQVVLDSAAC